MMQPWENGKNPNFWSNTAPPNFFCEFYLYLLDIVTSYHPMQFIGKLTNFLSKIWLCQSLDIMVSYHHLQYQKKLMI